MCVSDPRPTRILHLHRVSMHPFLSNGIREGGEEEGLLLYYVVLERAIERRGATSVDKTRSFRARNGDSERRGGGGGAIDRAETLRASPVAIGSSVGKLFGLALARLRF